MDRAIKCTTDGASQQDSPGYFGHIELAKPVFHIGFITTVLKVMRCVSYHSSKILIEKVGGELSVYLFTLPAMRWQRRLVPVSLSGCSLLAFLQAGHPVEFWMCAAG